MTSQRRSGAAPQSSAVPQVSPEEYLERLRANLATLVDLYPMRQVERYSGRSDDGIRKVIRGERTPGVDFMLELSCSLGADPADMFLPPKEFTMKIGPAGEGLGEPFFVNLQPGPRPGASSSRRTASTAYSRRKASKDPAGAATVDAVTAASILEADRATAPQKPARKTVATSAGKGPRNKKATGMYAQPVIDLRKHTRVTRRAA